MLILSVFLSKGLSDSRSDPNPTLTERKVCGSEDEFVKMFSGLPLIAGVEVFRKKGSEKTAELGLRSLCGVSAIDHVHDLVIGITKRFGSLLYIIRPRLFPDVQQRLRNLLIGVGRFYIDRFSCSNPTDTLCPPKFLLIPRL